MSDHTITLRAIEPEDLDLLYRIENDIRLWNVGATNVPYSRYTLHDYIATSSNDIYADRQLRLMVVNEHDEIVGMVDLVRFDPRHQRAEVGIIIIDAYRRRGYGFKAVARMCDYAAEVLHLHQLYAVVDTANAAACQLFHKAGFMQQVTLTDWLLSGNSYHEALLMQRFL